MAATSAESLGNAFISAFEAMGVDKEMAKRGSARYGSVDSWVASQVAQASVVGGAASAVPGVHHLGTIPDFLLVMHKISIMSWGIGYKKGCKIDAKLDLANIFAIWSGAASSDVLAAGTLSGVAVAGSVASGGASKFAVKVAAMIASELTGASTAAILTKVGAKGAGKVAGVIAGKLASLVVKAIAPQVGTILAAKFVGKQFTGWIPVAGAVVAAGINVWIMTGIASAARSYYSAKAAY